jgi:hypothetical protein
LSVKVKVETPCDTAAHEESPTESACDNLFGTPPEIRPSAVPEFLWAGFASSPGPAERRAHPDFTKLLTGGLVSYGGRNVTQEQPDLQPFFAHYASPRCVQKGAKCRQLYRAGLNNRLSA